MTALVSALLLGQTLAHPGMSVAEMNKEIAERSAYLKTAKRDLSHCAAKIKARNIVKRGETLVDRRTAVVQKLRNEVSMKKRALEKRDSWGSQDGDHHGSDYNYPHQDPHSQSGSGSTTEHWSQTYHHSDPYSTAHYSTESCTDHETSKSSSTAHSSTSTKVSSSSGTSLSSSISHSSSGASLSISATLSTSISSSLKSSSTLSSIASSSSSSTSTSSSKSSSLTSSSTSPSITSSSRVSTTSPSSTVSTTSSSGATLSTSTVTSKGSSTITMSGGNSTMTMPSGSNSMTMPSGSNSMTMPGGGPSGSGSMSGGMASTSTVSEVTVTGTQTCGQAAGGLATCISEFGANVAAESHEFTNLTGITPTTSGVETTLFGNHSCVLNPEGEVGPFYVTGEYIRSDITGGQDGVPVVVDGQFINVNTCEPIEDLYWDIWMANSTGVYGGVIGNGNGNDDDTSNLNNTFLRGLQPTDADGVAQFTAIFPGHYGGRATHMHVISHIGGTILSNGTYEGGDITHVGQLFFDQSLITEINTNISPYSTNSITIVDNVDDRVFTSETLTDSDPVFDYVLLGDDVSDGLFLWIDIGVDPSATYTASAAAYYWANGGHLE